MSTTEPADATNGQSDSNDLLNEAAARQKRTFISCNP